MLLNRAIVNCVDLLGYFVRHLHRRIRIFACFLKYLHFSIIPILVVTPFVISTIQRIEIELRSSLRFVNLSWYFVRRRIYFLPMIMLDLTG